MGGNNASIGETFIEESGKRMNKMVADSESAIGAGRGLLVARMANMNIYSLPEQYLAIDGVCPTPKYVSSVMLFPIAPVSYTHLTLPTT
ncbi:MAG: hypothetical protein JJD97_09765, partial [Gemmatimonadaceae bacterium]|nr:hypothetical protein [Gemmatimonadaceae bacterium]